MSFQEAEAPETLYVPQFISSCRQSNRIENEEPIFVLARCSCHNENKLFSLLNHGWPSHRYNGVSSFACVTGLNDQVIHLNETRYYLTIVVSYFCKIGKRTNAFKVAAQSLLDFEALANCNLSHYQAHGYVKDV